MAVVSKLLEGEHQQVLDVVWIEAQGDDHKEGVREAMKSDVARVLEGQCIPGSTIVLVPSKQLLDKKHGQVLDVVCTGVQGEVEDDECRLLEVVHGGVEVEFHAGQ